MKWYYVENGQQAGPVTEEQFLELRRSGRITPETLVWREGMSGWISCREARPDLESAAVPPIASAPATAPGGGVVCAECGKTFAPDEVIQVQDRWVCGGCKGIFLQRLSEGAQLPRAGNWVTEAELLARDYPVDVGARLSEGWNLFKANPGIIIGASVLVYLAIIGSSLIPIPFVNMILSLMLGGPLMGGIWLFYLKQLRNQRPTIGDAFSGFGPRFWQLVFVNFIPALASLAVFVIPLILGGAAIPMLARASQDGPMASMSMPLIGILGVIFVILVCVVIYLTVCWMFALPLVADKGLKFGRALSLSRRVVLKHWWGTFWFLIVCWFVCVLGALACFVGMLATCPTVFAALAHHYERVFGDLAPEQ